MVTGLSSTHADEFAGVFAHPALPGLTRNPLKERYYAREPFFREAFRDLDDVLGDTEDTVRRHGAVVVKPDGIALGVTTTVLDFYAGHGFRPIHAAPVQFLPATWRSIWMYQMTQASPERLRVNDYVLQGAGLALFFAGPDGLAYPAAVRLSELKGPAKQEEQQSDCLRRRVRQPNRIYSLVHTSDEPADLVREIGVLMRPQARRALARAMRIGKPDEESTRLLAQRRDLDRHPRRFDEDEARQRIRAAIDARAASMPDGPAAAALADARTALDSERPLDLIRFLSAVEDAGVPLDDWDIGVSTSGLIVADVMNGRKIIDNLGPAAWLTTTETSTT